MRDRVRDRDRVRRRDRVRVRVTWNGTQSNSRLSVGLCNAVDIYRAEGEGAREKGGQETWLAQQCQ